MLIAAAVVLNHQVPFNREFREFREFRELGTRRQRMTPASGDNAPCVLRCRGDISCVEAFPCIPNQTFGVVNVFLLI